MIKWRTNTSIRTWLPQLQSHRGYWIEGFQQNSLKSIQEAFKKNFRMSEFDVRMTKDEVVVLFHDEKYKSEWINQLSFEDFKNKAKGDYPDLSTLEDVLSWQSELNQKVSQNVFKLNIEIKSKKLFNSKLEKRVFELIQKYKAEAVVLISSFNPISLYRIKKLNPHIYRALLLTNDQESNFILNRMWLNFLCVPDVLHLRWIDFNSKNINIIKSKVPIVLWTVNELSQVEQHKEKIFGIISDRITPDLYP